MLVAGALLAIAAQGSAIQPRFPICGEGRRVTCVVDGDTFWLNRVKYRLADIDAPEVSQPQCRAEAQAGEQATLRLAQLLNAGPIELQEHGLDRYERTLVTVRQGGQSVGARMVREGHAREWGDRRGWC